MAEEDGNIVGHILFSPAMLVAEPNLPLMGLAPMAVLPARQRLGIGSQLVLEGLERCRRAHVKAVVLLGHADYYPRFSFVPASELSLCCEYDVPANAFTVRELERWCARRVFRNYSVPSNVCEVLARLRLSWAMGSSAPHRRTFTVLIDGGIGPQPHPNFIEVFDEVALNDGEGTVARAGEDGT